MKKLFNLLVAVGIFVLIGTAGASDAGTISLGDTLIQILIAVLLIASGLCGRRSLRPQNRQKKKKISHFTEIAA